MTEESEYVEVVESCIGDLVETFTKAPYTFYKEHDMHCYLYHLIYTKLYRDQSAEKPHTSDDKETILLHKEYPLVYKEDRRRGTFDMVVLNPERIKEVSATKEFRVTKEPINPLIAIEFAFNSGTEHFIKDHKRITESLKEGVKKGYILHLMRDVNLKDHIEKQKRKKKSTTFSTLRDEIDDEVNKINDLNKKDVKIWYVDVFPENDRKEIKTKNWIKVRGK